MKNIPNTFLQYASEILGETTNGLTGPQIQVYFVAKAAELNVEIPHHSYPFDTPNKRTALLENLMCFNNDEKYSVIEELCDYRDSKEFDILRRRLIERYSDNERNTLPQEKSTDQNQEEIENIIEGIPERPKNSPTVSKKLPIIERLWFKYVMAILGGLLILATLLDIIFGWIGIFSNN